MRVLLRNIQTGLFYAGDERWTESSALAWDFKQPDLAAKAYTEVHLSDGEIVVEEGTAVRLIHPPFPAPEAVRRPV
ncbi:MAG TPA: hypothetical protein VHP11_15355 [Tepidisphaeraceae bacterium]|nr:hypothetical protein [Tepidisphaeraceae bacterium]